MSFDNWHVVYRRMHLSYNMINVYVLFIYHMYHLLSFYIWSHV